MNGFELPIFPEGCVATTVTTSVWVGVLVVVWANRRLGWSLAGLVVPGYLVPLLLIRPISVAVILTEAVATYLVASVLSRSLRYTALWSDLFGRDRFLGIVVVSVVIRAVGDGFLLPTVGLWLSETHQLNATLTNQLHSVGLVIVALVANTFWKPGLVRGSVPLVATTAVTFLIVRYLLVPWTTFDVGNLVYAYEDVASSLLASPKSYMVLLTTAAIASHMNLRFSWEYNGLLVPALLALLWPEPAKIATTVVESVVIAVISHQLFRSPFLRNQVLQSGQKIAALFTIAFAYRLCLAWGSWLLFPDIKATAGFGFGYLISTLLALLYLERGHAMRTVSSALQVSLAGVIVANVIGFGLVHLPTFSDSGHRLSAAQVVPPRSEHGLVEILRQDKLQFYESAAVQASYLRPGQQHRFAELMQLLRKGAPLSANERAAYVKQFRSLGFTLAFVEQQYAYVAARTEIPNHGIYVVNLENSDGLAIAVPRPLSEPFTLEAGLHIFQELDAGLLLIAGDVQCHDPATLAVRDQRMRRSLFSTVCARLDEGQIMRIRGLPESASTEGAGILRIAKGLPRQLDAKRLQSIVGSFAVDWKPAGKRPRRYAELVLSRDARAALYAHLVVPSRRQASVVKEFKEPLLSWLLDRKQRMAPAESELYVAPRQEELIMLDQEVLRPLLGLLETEGPDETNTLAAINASASVVDLEVVRFVDSRSERAYLILQDTPGAAASRHWGTYVFANAPQSPVVWEVPRPLWEHNTMEMAADAFLRQQGRALLLTGAHIHSNRDGASDVGELSNRLTLFNLVHQALLRQDAGRASLVVQVRAMKDPVQYDLLLATDDGSTRLSELSPIKRELVDWLAEDDLTIGYADGSRPVAGYELGSTAPQMAMRYSTDVEFVSAWLSPRLRRQYRQTREDSTLHAQIAALGLEWITLDVSDWQLFAERLPSESDSRWQKVRTLVHAYLKSRDVVLLQRLLQCDGVRARFLIDAATRQAVMLVTIGSETLLVNLAELRGSPLAFYADNLSDRTVHDFLNSRKSWLWAEEDAL